MRSQQHPGISLAIIKDGKIVKVQGYGLADIEGKVPATSETIYDIAFRSGSRLQYRRETPFASSCSNPVNGRAILVTAPAAGHPRWRGDGRELYFTAPEASGGRRGNADKTAIMAVPVSWTRQGPEFGPARRLFVVDPRSPRPTSTP